MDILVIPAFQVTAFNMQTSTDGKIILRVFKFLSCRNSDFFAGNNYPFSSIKSRNRNRIQKFTIYIVLILPTQHAG